jgi:hypothetical protein
MNSYSTGLVLNSYSLPLNTMNSYSTGLVLNSYSLPLNTMNSYSTGLVLNSYSLPLNTMNSYSTGLVLNSYIPVNALNSLLTIAQQRVKYHATEFKSTYSTVLVFYSTYASNLFS